LISPGGAIAALSGVTGERMLLPVRFDGGWLRDVSRALPSPALLTPLELRVVTGKELAQGKQRWRGCCRCCAHSSA